MSICLSDNNKVDAFALPLAVSLRQLSEEQAKDEQLRAILADPDFPLSLQKANNFYSESQSDLCYSRGPGREHVAWVLVTLGKSAALLRKVAGDVLSARAHERLSAAARRAVLYSAARTARDGGSSGGSGEPLLESRLRSGADPSEARETAPIRRARRDLQCVVSI
ncbi:unnamed protein product [Trichogramma brassicae]|uniref:Uncharacterized protein n=1 Tax=Trichogramma brassicae TaxID=86971 RepID=A0A6H5HWL3_9HYME|nr:unnamed protein product [Trichogramma brassicae]